MTSADIGSGFLAGLLSCLSPESFLLLPLLTAAAGASGRAGVIAALAGSAISLVLTGMLAVSLGASLGLEAVWLRRLVCALLLAQGLILMSDRLTERFALFTGGSGGFAGPVASVPGTLFRHCLLALLVGANWLPRVGPVLGQATLMAAEGRNVPLALQILLAFGAGAGLPWIMAGQAIRLIIGPSAATGMGGKSFLGFVLMIVGALGISGFDATLVQAVSPVFPGWARALVTKY